jgi:5'-nucleotidase
VVEDWITRHDHEYCLELDPPSEPGCLSEPVGATAVALVGEELEIRTHETNLGNWIADQAREAFDADVAFVNSGALRLNQDIPAGPITERHLRELFAYPDSELVAMTITGEILQQVINRSVENWTGEGHFLQVSGLAFRHDPACGGATELTLLSRTSDGRVETRPVEADEPLKAVTLGYLSAGGDGYHCLAEGGVPTGEARRNFLALVRERLRTSGEIGPAAEGRICNRLRTDRPCLVPDYSDAPPLTTVSCSRDAPAAPPTGG